MNKRQKAYLPLKRLIAIFGSLIGIIVCFALFWWWIFIINLFATKGKPIFLSERVGKNGKKFKLIKFRSMKNDVDPNLTANSENLDELKTGFGKFLRKTSLDETLQLFNIFVGQMAFIGPRPLIDIGEDSVTNQMRKENGTIQLRPGISGYAQIHSRAKLNYIEKAKYDLVYLQKISLWFDIKIFFATLFGVQFSLKGK